MPTSTVRQDAPSTCRREVISASPHRTGLPNRSQNQPRLRMSCSSTSFNNRSKCDKKRPKASGSQGLSVKYLSNMSLFDERLSAVANGESVGKDSANEPGKEFFDDSVVKFELTLLSVQKIIVAVKHQIQVYAQLITVQSLCQRCDELTAGAFDLLHLRNPVVVPANSEVDPWSVVFRQLYILEKCA